MARCVERHPEASAEGSLPGLQRRSQEDIGRGEGPDREEEGNEDGPELGGILRCAQDGPEAVRT